MHTLRINRQTLVIVGRGKDSLVFNDVSSHPFTDGVQVCRALEGVGGLPRFGQRRKQNADQQRDDPDDDEELDECKTV